MSEILRMKTPVTYYGGKQLMARHILPLIPVHNLYCEPFCGGAAIFFAKESSGVEVLNCDALTESVNLYGWSQRCFDSKVSVAAKSGNQKTKTEVLTMNFDYL